MTKKEALSLYERFHGRIFFAYIIIMTCIAFGIFELRECVAQAPSDLSQGEKTKSPLEYLRKNP